MSEPRIGYLIPEWPGQTHIWMWREIQHLRKWGANITIFSTRRPPERDRARHAFAEEAERETVYLWPAGLGRLLTSLAWVKLRHPIGYLKALKLGMTLPVDKRPAIRTVLPLIFPSSILAREVTRRGITRLHSHTCSSSAILCMMVKRMIGIPFSMTLNANIGWWGGAMAQKFADADFTVAIAQWLLDEIHRDFPTLSASQSLLARIGVDTDRWSPDGRADQATANGARLMTVGRLHASKGHDILLRAVKILADEGKDVTLRLAGSGPERENLERLAAELGLTDRVNFLGSLSEDQVMSELRRSDIFVLASHAEPLGVVYMEAMALGLPTIGTAAGGVREIISDGENGILVPPADPEALARAIGALMADDQRRHRLGHAAREAIVAQFDSRLGAAILYQKLFGSPPSA